MKVISYGVWGDNPTYTVGAIKNADLAARLFPDWVCVFYCFDSVPADTIKELKSRPNVLVRQVKGEGNRRSAVERFFPADEDGVEFLICRDTDSRLSERERLAVDEWISSGADLHVMRDHPYHGVPIPAGMWGVRGGKLKGIQQYAKEYVSIADPQYKFQDQDFLTSWVWSKAVGGQLSVCIHDPFFQKVPFPVGSTRGGSNGGVWFIGQCFDEHDKYNSQADIAVLQKTETTP